MVMLQNQSEQHSRGDKLLNVILNSKVAVEIGLTHRSKLSINRIAHSRSPRLWIEFAISNNPKQLQACGCWAGERWFVVTAYPAGRESECPRTQ